MKNYKEKLEITQEEINKIKQNSPKSLPLNPTSQGYSGQEVRKKMYMSICGDKDSVLALLIDRIRLVGEGLDTIEKDSNVVANNGEQAEENLKTLEVKGRNYKLPQIEMEVCEYVPKDSSIIKGLIIYNEDGSADKYSFYQEPLDFATNEDIISLFDNKARGDTNG